MMNKENIKNIILDEFYREDDFNWNIPTDKIYKLHIQSQIDLLKNFIEHPTKPGYKRHDVLDKIKELENLKNELNG